MLSWSSRGSIPCGCSSVSSRREPSGSLAEDPKGSLLLPCWRCSLSVWLAQDLSDWLAQERTDLVRPRARSYRRGIFQSAPSSTNARRVERHPRPAYRQARPCSSRGVRSPQVSISQYMVFVEETSVSPSESRLQTKRTRLFSLKYKIADKTATLSLRDCQWTTRTVCLRWFGTFGGSVVESSSLITLMTVCRLWGAGVP